MRKILFLTLLVLIGCMAATDNTSHSMKPNQAEAEAATVFQSKGFVSLQIMDNKKSTFSGEKEGLQYPNCKLYGDRSIYIVTVESTEDKAAREYVSRFNTEMERLRALNDGCITAN